MRDVIAAVEVIIDVDFPVAVEVVRATLEKTQRIQPQRSDAFNEAGKKMRKRFHLRMQIHEYKILPSFDSDGDESVLSAIKVADAVKVRCSFERAIDTVGPAVIGAAEIGGAAGGFSDDRCSVMAANVKESAKHAIGAARDEQRLAEKIRGEEFTASGDLVGATDYLPIPMENGAFFQRGNALVRVPRGRGCVSVRQRGMRIVGMDDFSERFHSLLPDPLKGFCSMIMA